MKGFSIVELTVSLLIAGILAGIGIPSYLRHVEKARLLEIEVFLRTIQKEHSIMFTEQGRLVRNWNEMQADDTLNINYGGSTYAYNSDYHYFIVRFRRRKDISVVLFSRKGKDHHLLNTRVDDDLLINELCMFTGNSLVATCR